MRLYLSVIYTFSSVQSLSRVWLFETPWIAACQASLSITNSQSSLRLTSIESVMPFSHLNPLSSPSPPAPNPSQHQSLFQWVNSSHEVAKVLEFQASAICEPNWTELVYIVTNIFDVQIFLNFDLVCKKSLFPLYFVKNILEIIVASTSVCVLFLSQFESQIYLEGSACWFANLRYLVITYWGILMM